MHLKRKLPLVSGVLAVFLTLSLCDVAVAQDDPKNAPEYESLEVQDIIEKMIVAHGGMKRWKRIPSLSYDFVMHLSSLASTDGGDGGGDGDGDGYDGDGDSVARSPWSIWRTGKYCLDMKSHRGFVELPFEKASIASDGKKVWSNNYEPGNTPYWRLWHHATYLNLPWLTQSSDVRILDPGKGRLPGQEGDFHKIRMIFKRDGNLIPEGYYDLYVHPKSHRLTGVKYTTAYASVPPGMPANVNAFSEVLRITDEYEEVDGLLFPVRYQSYDPTGRALLGLHMLVNLSVKNKLSRSQLKMSSDSVVFADMTPVVSLTTKKTLYARRVVGKNPVIDGDLQDAVWKAADKRGQGFITDNLDAPSEPTEFSVLYDDNHLYVGIYLPDTKPKDIRRVSGEKDDVNGDRIALFLDTNLDGKSAFVFVTNAAGVQRDQYGEDNGITWSTDYEAKWKSAVAVNRDGWTAEFQIPFSVLDVSGKNKEWGIQLTRFIDREKESSSWQPVNPRSGFVGSFGQLVGLESAFPTD